jgi:hypothetical protein
MLGPLRKRGPAGGAFGKIFQGIMPLVKRFGQVEWDRVNIGRLTLAGSLRATREVWRAQAISPQIRHLS